MEKRPSSDRRHWRDIAKELCAWKTAFNRFNRWSKNVHDSQVARDFIEAVGKAQYFIADKGYDDQKMREKAIEHGMTAIIPKRKNAKQQNVDFDRYLYRLRHLVENTFARLRHFYSIKHFGNQAKRHLRKFKGISKEHFELYLKECKWRFNNSEIRVQISIFKQLVKQDLS